MITAAATTSELADLVATVQTWLYLPDPSALYAVLGTVAANRMGYRSGSGDPVWLLLVGPASNGKTELLNLLDGFDDVHPVSTFTEAGLLCRGPKQDDGRSSLAGALVDDWATVDGRLCGILSFKDLSGLLSRGPETGEGLFAALREVYDGIWVRRLGSDSGTSLAWQGHGGLVGAATDAIDDRAAQLASLGPRFLLHRMPRFDADQLDAYQRQALGNVGSQQAMRADLAARVADFMAGVTIPAVPEPVEDPDALMATARLVTLARSHVGRGAGVFRDIEAVHEAELPARMQAALAQLNGGLRAIGCAPGLAWRATARTAFGSVPALRWRALSRLLVEGRVTSVGLERATGLPSRLVDQTFEDLAAHGLVRNDQQHWEATSETVDLWARCGASLD